MKLSLTLLLALAATLLTGSPAPALTAATAPAATTSSAATPAATTPSATTEIQRAVFAGGCFWCVEAAFEGIPGVIDVVSGYAGGTRAEASYERVSAGGTGHIEVVQVTYDPQRIGYERLLEIFWRNIDPLDAGGQFCDRGSSYRSAIFVGSPAEQRLAETTKAALAARFGKPIATRIIAAAPFYAAEAYHQDYHSKNPVRYKFYSTSCGRAARLDALWGKEASDR